MIDFFNQILTWIGSGIYDFATETWAWVIIKVMIFKIESQLFMMVFAWDIAKDIVNQLNISQEIKSALSALPAQTVEHLNFFNIINGINLIINAFMTRFVMRFMGM